ncbi:MAG: hypothetical protein GEU75_14130 [Dehalococcoidia bacterium]|nr:hypothetical protein [Dehalococcoidia bacterium]
MFRLALLMPPVLLLISGLAMACVAPFAWGAGSHVGLPGWMPPLSGALFAVPAIWIGFTAFRETLRRSREGFSVLHMQLGLGLFLFLILALIEVALTARITDTATYDSLRNADGTIRTTSTAFLLITLAGTAFAAGWLSVGAYLYAHGITSDNASRFEHAWDEPDPMEDFLRGRTPRRR